MKKALLALCVLAMVQPPGGCACPGEQAFTAYDFGADFQFGTAVAQWQVSGDHSPDGPVRSNWSAWAAMGKTTSGQQNPDGNGFYTLFHEDLDRAEALGLKAFRMGIDWSRVEPEPDVFNDAELDHLVEVLTAARDRGLEPVLTLYHWVVPPWVQNPDPDAPEGALDRLSQWDSGVVDDFDEFVRRVIPRVKGLVDTYTVLNEPFSVISAGYLAALFPPGLALGIEPARQVGLAIKELDDEDANGDGKDSFVGMTMTANAFYPEEKDNADEAFAVEQISYIFNDWMMIALTTGDLDVDLDGSFDNSETTPPEGHYPELEQRLDFIGVQYYGPVMVDDNPLFVDLDPLYGLPVLEVEEYDPDLPHNGMGREIRAKGFRDTLDIYARYELPILLTENGTTTNGVPRLDDEENLLELPMEQEQAAMYLIEHLWEVGRAMDEGMDIRAYYHWTLADNFEWVEGRYQRFGAYSVDFEAADRPRTLSLMGEALGDVVEANGINEEIWDRYVLDKYPTDLRADGGLTITGRARPLPSDP
jgi:beta-glucosidase